MREILKGLAVEIVACIAFTAVLFGINILFS